MDVAQPPPIVVDGGPAQADLSSGEPIPPTPVEPLPPPAPSTNEPTEPPPGAPAEAALPAAPVPSEPAKIFPNTPALLQPRPPPSIDEPGDDAEDEPKLEFGVGTFLLAGALPSGFIGAAPFVFLNMGSGVFIRPSISLGRPPSTPVSATWAAARLDTCSRLSGRYARGQGMGLDLCGGFDVGLSYVSSGSSEGTPTSSLAQPYLDIGPSVDLRAEVDRLIVSLRGVAGFNIAHQSFLDATSTPVDAGSWSLRAEIDFSWRARSDRQPVESPNGAYSAMR